MLWQTVNVMKMAATIKATFDVCRNIVFPFEPPTIGTSCFSPAFCSDRRTGLFNAGHLSVRASDWPQRHHLFIVIEITHG